MLIVVILWVALGLEKSEWARMQKIGSVRSWREGWKVPRTLEGDLELRPSCSSHGGTGSTSHD